MEGLKNKFAECKAEGRVCLIILQLLPLHTATWMLIVV